MIAGMNTNTIKIFIDRLVNEGEFSQKGQFDSSFIELKGPEKIDGDISYDLKAYITDDHLVINFDTSCNILMPCKICNELTPVAIKCIKQSHLEPLENVKKGVFDASSCIRDAILLAMPDFTECQGNCPEREFIKKFLKTENQQAETYQPFKGL